MNKKHYIIALLITFFALACKKIEPPVDETEANEPIYLLEGLINEDSIKLYVNDTTVFISDSPYNMNGVEAYSSTISDLETGFELKMTVIRPEIFLDEDGVKLIENGELDFLVHEEICKSFDFPDGSNQGDYFGISINTETTQGNVVDIKEYGKYSADLKFSNISSQTYELPVEFGFKDEILNPYFEADGLGSVLSYTAEDNGLIHEWKIDGNVVNDSFAGEQQLSDGIHRISHYVEDDYDNVATYTTLVYFQNGLYKWTLETSYCSPNIVENNYGRVFIEVKYNGIEYTSVYNPENFNNQLEISNIVYVVNPNTQSIDFVKFNIKFDAELKTQDNLKTLNLKDMNGTFHIAVN